MPRTPCQNETRTGSFSHPRRRERRSHDARKRRLRRRELRIQLDNPPRCSKSLSRVGVAVGVHPRVRGGALGVDEEVYAVYPGASRGSHALAERERERDDARARRERASPGRTLAFPPSERYMTTTEALFTSAASASSSRISTREASASPSAKTLCRASEASAASSSKPTARARVLPRGGDAHPPVAAPQVVHDVFRLHARQAKHARHHVRRGGHVGAKPPTEEELRPRPEPQTPRAGHRAPRSGPVEPVTTMHRGEVRSNPQPARRVIHHTFIQHILQHSTRRSFVQSSVRVFPLPSVSSRERITWR